MVLSKETRGAAVGEIVEKWGAETGRTSGEVISNNLALYGKDSIPIIRHFFGATYDSSSGDSGAPVYFIDPQTMKIYTVGVHKGRGTKNGKEMAIFSSVFNICEIFNVQRY